MSAEAVLGDTAANGAAKPPAAYIIVCSKEGGDPVELPLGTDSALLVSTLQIEYTGALGIKYRNPATGVFRVMAPVGDKIFPPAGGWTDAQYMACCPKGMGERPWMPDGPPPNKAMRLGESAPSASWGQGPDRGSTNFAPVGMRGGPKTDTSPITGNLIDPVTGRSCFSHCAVCDVYLNAPDQHAAHFNGKKHKEKEGRVAGPPRGGGGGARGGFRGFRGGGDGGGRGRGGPPPFRGGGRGRGGPPPPFRGGRGGMGGGGGGGGPPPAGGGGGWAGVGDGPMGMGLGPNYTSF